MSWTKYAIALNLRQMGRPTAFTPQTIRKVQHDRRTAEQAGNRERTVSPQAGHHSGGAGNEQS